MTDAELTQYIVDTLPGVETTDNFGYKFFFYGANRMLPFATLIAADSDHDRTSDLNRPGVFRLNIGVSRQMFQSLFGVDCVDVSQYDYTALDRFMPHPDYAAQNWICVFSPSQATWDRVRTFLAEAHELARALATKRPKAE